MEKKRIIIGRLCLEHNVFLKKLTNIYNVYTTDIACCKCDKALLKDVTSVTMSSEEMERFLDFYTSNTMLSSIGLREASCLFVGYERSLDVVVRDITTEIVCIKLGVNYLKLPNLIEGNNLLQERNDVYQERKMNILYIPHKIKCL